MDLEQKTPGQGSHIVLNIKFNGLLSCVKLLAEDTRTRVPETHANSKVKSSYQLLAKKNTEVLKVSHRSPEGQVDMRIFLRSLFFVFIY